MKCEVIDLFCGIGGLTNGLISSGLCVKAGYDNDPTCAFAYNKNNKVEFYLKNIRETSSSEIAKNYSKSALKVLVGCAPCQPFSTMRIKCKRKNFYDEKYDLLLEFARIINEIHPIIISMENVPRIKKTKVYNRFLNVLIKNGYQYSENIVYCPDYGIAQNRRRFVLLASKLGNIDLIKPTHNKEKVNIKNYIYDLPRIKAGEICKSDALHRSANLSDLNLKRIKLSKPGGSWLDWPKKYRCKCHLKSTGKTYSSVYGRMSWDKIGPTITTEFFNYGTGRFGHPTQDRALSLREGAILQTFPKKYNFIDPSKKFVFNDIARQIGNAVPPRLGEIIGKSIMNHVRCYGVHYEK